MGRSMSQASWPLHDAKNRLSTVIDAARKGEAQLVTRHNRPVALQERGRDDGLADPSVGSGYEETAEHCVDPSRTPARAAAN